jgi:hypothetical protein
MSATEFRVAGAGGIWEKGVWVAAGEAAPPRKEESDIDGDEIVGEGVGGAGEAGAGDTGVVVEALGGAPA